MDRFFPRPFVFTGKEETITIRSLPSSFGVALLTGPPKNKRREDSFLLD